MIGRNVTLKDSQAEDENNRVQSGVRFITAVFFRQMLEVDISGGSRGGGVGRHSTFAIKRPFLELINTAYSAGKSMFSTCLHCLGHKRISINNSFNLLVNICVGSQLFQCQVLGSNSFSYQQKYMKNRRFLKYYFRYECRIYTHTHTIPHIYFR